MCFSSHSSGQASLQAEETFKTQPKCCNLWSQYTRNNYYNRFLVGSRNSGTALNHSIWWLTNRKQFNKNEREFTDGERKVEKNQPWHGEKHKKHRAEHRNGHCMFDRGHVTSLNGSKGNGMVSLTSPTLHSRVMRGMRKKRSSQKVSTSRGPPAPFAFNKVAESSAHIEQEVASDFLRSPVRIHGNIHECPDNAKKKKKRG